VPDHPDHEELAAFQAGDGDRRRRSDLEAHLEGCPSCAEVVAAVGHARGRLALLEEPELPPGLHDRLAAAVDAEATQAVILRPAPWYRRPVAWGAAAALLLAVLAIPLLNPTGGGVDTAAGGAGGGSAAQEADLGASVAGGAEVPVIQVSGEVSAAALLSRLKDDGQARQALESATASARRLARPEAAAPGDSPGATAAPEADPGVAAMPGSGPGQATASRDSQAGPATTSSQRRYAGDTSRSAGTPPAAEGGRVAQASCLAAALAAATPATTPLVPAFFVQGSYDGRPATVLVTTSTGQPGRVDLWVFPRGDCSTAPLATERLR
jgi:hypothetical protein